MQGNAKFDLKKGADSTVEYDHASMDSVCSAKKPEDVLRYVVTSETGCARLCDATVFPNKCSAFQYYPLVDYAHA